MNDSGLNQSADFLKRLSEVFFSVDFMIIGMLLEEWNQSLAIFIVITNLL